MKEILRRVGIVLFCLIGLFVIFFFNGIALSIAKEGAIIIGSKLLILNLFLLGVCVILLTAYFLFFLISWYSFSLIKRYWQGKESTNVKVRLSY